MFHFELEGGIDWGPGGRRFRPVASGAEMKNHPMKKGEGGGGGQGGFHGARFIFAKIKKVTLPRKKKSPGPARNLFKPSKKKKNPSR